MRILTTESFKKIVPLLRENYGNLHAQMAVKLPPSVAEMFATFTLQAAGATGQWSVTLPDEEDLRPFSQASELEKDQISIAIKHACEALRTTFPAMAGKLVEVPDTDSIFFARTRGGVRVVLTQWGFRRVKAQGGTSIVRLCLERASHLTDAPVRIRVLNSDRTPAAGRDFTLLIFNNELPFTTDEAGIFNAGHIKVDARFRVEAADGSKSEAFTVEAGRDMYDVVIDLPTALTVRVLDAGGNPLAGVDTTCGDRHQATGPDGEAAYKLVFRGEEPVAVGADGFAPVTHTLKAVAEQNVVEFRRPPLPEVPGGGGQSDGAGDENDGELPPSGDIRVRLLDKHGIPLCDLPVRVYCRKGFEDTRTDQAGCIFLRRTDLVPGEKPRIELRRPRPQRRNDKEPQPTSNTPMK